MDKLFEGCYLISAERYMDKRGFFQEIYRQGGSLDFDLGHGKEWKQISYSVSRKGVVRGLHCSPHAKFVQCLSGSVYDVVVDLREGSDTYGKWAGVWLSEGSTHQLYVPANCAHGFYSNDDNTVLLYLQDGLWSGEKDRNYHYSSFGIEWPVEPTIVSEKDLGSPKDFVDTSS